MPHYLVTDCVKEKERAHISGMKEPGYNAHDSAFGYYCPNCGGKVKEIHRYFSDSEIEKIKKSLKKY